MYSTNYLSDSSEVINMVTSINSNRIINESTNHSHLDLANDYISSNGGAMQIVNYLPSGELLHHNGQLIQSVKKMDPNGYMQAKEQSQLMHIYGPDASSTIITTSSGGSMHNPLPMLTPLKYVEYVGPVNDANDESDKSDCESIHESPSKNVKRNLPHKKRITKKLNQQEHFSMMMSPDRSMQSSNNPFVCSLCDGAAFGEQFEFFMHLKQHYETSGHQVVIRRKHDSETDHNIDTRQHHVEVSTANFIESLADTPQHIKDEEDLQREPGLPEIDEFNEFSEPEDMMEDLRKEVEKVVETIDDNECLPEATWNYPVPDEIDAAEAHEEELQLYAENLDNNYVDDMSHEPADSSSNHVVEESTNTDHFASQYDDDDDDDDDVTLEQVRQSLQKSAKSGDEAKNYQPDAEDLELTECLKKIHNFKCTIATCNKAFNSRTALGYHLKTHCLERRFLCNDCGKKFLTNGALKVHQRLHTNDRPYECKFPNCGKSFRQWGDLKYHETSIHSDKKDHVCEFCAKAFARKYSLVIHRRIHTGERNYRCETCDKSFRASSYLLNHKRIHTGEKPYCCSLASCQKKFRVVGDLKRHMKIHERAKGIPKEKKKELVPGIIKKEPEVQEAIVHELVETNDGCVDLSFKEEDKSTVIIIEKNVDHNEKNEIEKMSRKGIGRKSLKSRKSK